MVFSVPLSIKRGSHLRFAVAFLELAALPLWLSDQGINVRRRRRKPVFLLPLTRLHDPDSVSSRWGRQGGDLSPGGS